jgi:HD-GYP domain-containing protein (c-di-GMP phosphodiesterase class II)
MVREHPVVGAKIVAELEFPAEVVPMVRSHHEHWDGTGYPDGLCAEQIPEAARIMSIADIFDALTSARSFREAYTVSEAIDIMQQEAGRTIDPDMFQKFRALIERGETAMA